MSQLVHKFSANPGYCKDLWVPIPQEKHTWALGQQQQEQVQKQRPEKPRAGFSCGSVCKVDSMKGWTLKRLLKV